MTGERPFVSVIIPTYNRSSLLRQTVETFVAQTYPADSWELILVDNNSTDNTWSVIQAMAVGEGRIRPLRELRKGAHYARNSGAMVARGSILYFTDDDMLADPELLENITGVFDADDRIASVTGKVLPRWDTEPPAWVLKHLRNALLSLNDLGEATMISDDDPGVFSCHQAVRRDAFIEAGGFNPDTNAGLFTGDNETGLNIKLRKRGYRFAYVGTAVTRHMIPESRMTQRYLNRRMADQGFCDSYTDYRSIRPGKGRLARRIVAHSTLIAVSALKAGARRAVGDTRWRLDLARIWYHRNRAVYDARLFSDEHWRKFALRDNWLTDAAEVKQ
ncbi:MAG: glycosyltransferase [Gemmatimonadaceae bacterium]